MSGDGSNEASSPFTALSVTTAVVIFTVTSLITIFCVLSARTRRHKMILQPLKPAPRHLVAAPGTTDLAWSRHLPSLPSHAPRTDGSPQSLYQSVYSDTVCPTMKSSWASTAVPLSELWSASQLASRHTYTFPSRQIQPISLHYYNHF